VYGHVTKIGWYPSAHGIVAGGFYAPQLDTYFTGVNESDGVFFHGDPIWNTAQRQNRRTANIFWVGFIREFDYLV